jgi:hypothetical protein
VIYPGQPGHAAIESRLTDDLEPRHVGDDVLLQFEEGNPMRPIIVGRLRKSVAWHGPADRPQVEIKADGERLVVHAEKEITLRCGQASITLTSAGKVLIRGTYISSRSTGVQRIQGASLQLN